MKFVVTHYPLNEVDVRLASDTIQTIKKVLWWIYYAIAAVFLFIVFGRRSSSSHKK